METAVIVAIVSVVITTLALYTKVVFDYASIKTILQGHEAILKKIDIFVENITGDVEEIKQELITKVDKKEFDELKEKFIGLLATHDSIHSIRKD